MAVNWQQPDRDLWNKFEQLLQKGVRTLQRGVTGGTTATSRTQMGWCKRPCTNDSCDGMEVMNNFGGRAGHPVDSLCLVMPGNTWWTLTVAKVTGCHCIVGDEASKSRHPSLTVIAEEHHRREVLQIVRCPWVLDANRSVIRVSMGHLKHSWCRSFEVATSGQEKAMLFLDVAGERCSAPLGLQGFILNSWTLIHWHKYWFTIWKSMPYIL